MAGTHSSMTCQAAAANQDLAAAKTPAAATPTPAAAAAVARMQKRSAPDSYFVSEANSGVPQPAQLKVPVRCSCEMAGSTQQS